MVKKLFITGGCYVGSFILIIANFFVMVKVCNCVVDFLELTMHDKALVEFIQILLIPCVMFEAVFVKSLIKELIDSSEYYCQE